MSHTRGIPKIIKKTKLNIGGAGGTTKGRSNLLPFVF
jgi:hypothetical protein